MAGVVIADSAQLGLLPDADPEGVKPQRSEVFGKHPHRAVPPEQRREDRHCFRLQPQGAVLPFAEVGTALDKVKASKAYKGTVLALEFLVLTACRSGEVRLARWDEVNLEAEPWTVPASRMKAKRDHRVLLSARALEILHEARGLSNGAGLVFPSAHGRAISDNTVSKLLRDLGIEAVPHGFRSSFRDWAAECPDAPREVCELALAHVNSDRVEAAYHRTDPIERRWVLMEEWASVVEGREEARREAEP